jgi:hypothetical protein
VAPPAHVRPSIVMVLMDDASCTYVVLTSDNGYHLGQLQLKGGKGTPYDFDTRVPLVIVGPGVAPGPRQQFLSNTDLAPPSRRLAGLKPPRSMSGTSFAWSLHHARSQGGRYAFYEHTFARAQPGEVDNDIPTGGDLEEIPAYIGVRGKQGMLVRFDLDNSGGARTTRGSCTATTFHGRTATSSNRTTPSRGRASSCSGCRRGPLRSDTMPRRHPLRPRVRPTCRTRSCGRPGPPYDG